KSFTEDGRKLFEEILDDYIDDKILMKLYGKEILKDCLKIKNYSILRRI
ncbi:2224_t:CDS:1, partial [Gigaspora rosea]